MIALLLTLILTSFVVTYLSIPYYIRFTRNIGIVGTDMHKVGKPIFSTSGGITVMLGLFAGLMLYIFINTFIFKDKTNIIEIFAAITSIMLITFIGFLDDLRVRKNKDETGEIREGLKRKIKPFLVLPAAIPLMVISAGVSEMTLPLIGRIEFGLIYPLILVPIGVLGAANMTNLLGGLNGTESGMGIVYTLMLGLYALVHAEVVATIIAFSAFGALLAFYQFNKVPAKLLPGDSTQYILGATIVCIAILGNMEKVALVVALPFFIEYILKLRGGLKKVTVGDITEHGTVKSRYNKIYSIPHIFMRSGKYTEKQVVNFMILMEVIFASLIWFI